MGNPAVDVKKSEDGIVTLSTGVRVKFTPVGVGLIDEVTSHIAEPKVPMWHNKEMERDEPNPVDPDYVAAMDKFNRAKGAAVIDTLMVFGVELVDPLPDDSQWVPKLKFLCKKTGTNFDALPLGDPDEKVLLYKKMIAFGNRDVKEELFRRTGVGDEEVEKAKESFRGNA